MKNQSKPNTGTLWNNRKRKDENSPDVTGAVDVNGKPLRISGWWRRSKTQKGELYLSLAFSEPKQDEAKEGEE